MRLTKKVQNQLKRFGANIAAFRQERGFTIKEFSKVTGIKEEYLKKIEIGKAPGLTMSKIKRIADFLRISVIDLFDNV